MEGSWRPPELSAASGPGAQPPPAVPAEGDPWAVKRSLGRAWGFSVLSFGLGLGFLVLYVGFIILSIVIAVTSGTTSS